MSLTNLRDDFVEIEPRLAHLIDKFLEGFRNLCIDLEHRLDKKIRSLFEKGEALSTRLDDADFVKWVIGCRRWGRSLALQRTPPPPPVPLTRPQAGMDRLPPAAKPLPFLRGHSLPAGSRPPGERQPAGGARGPGGAPPQGGVPFDSEGVCLAGGQGWTHVWVPPWCSDHCRHIILKTFKCDKVQSRVNNAKPPI